MSWSPLHCLIPSVALILVLQLAACCSQYLEMRVFALILSIAFVWCLVSAAPAPEPHQYTYKQTTRREILERRVRPAFEIRPSSPVYPSCSYSSPDYDVAIYEGVSVDASFSATGGSMGLAVPSLKRCIELCREPSCKHTTGRMTEASGDIDSL